MTTLHIDSETTILWLPSSRQRFSLSRTTARAIRDSLSRTTATVLQLHELLSQSDEALNRLRDSTPGAPQSEPAPDMNPPFSGETF